MVISGHCYAHQSNQKSLASLIIASDYLLDIDGEITRYPTADVEVSAPLGNLPTRFTFSDGRVFVANAQVRLEANTASNWLHRIEAKWSLAVVAVVMMIGLLFAGFRYGLPYASQRVAHAVPTSVAEDISTLVLNQLDKQLEPSQLSASQQQKIRERIAEHAEVLELSHPINIEFRYLEQQANAFALAGGTIVILDDLVSLAATPAELDSVIFHELGHVHGRHALTSMVRASLISVSFALLTGESSGLLDNLTSLAILAEQMQYSRNHEREADAFALEAMDKIYDSTEPMLSMFKKLLSGQESHGLDWLSTHPNAQQRLQDIMIFQTAD